MSNPAKSRPADIIAAVILVLLAAVIAIPTFIAAWRGLSPLPLYDQWEYLDPSYVWNQLFALHAEHRIVFSKLVFLADLCLLGGKNIAEFIVTALMLLALGAVYFSAIGLQRPPSFARRAIAAALVISFAVSPPTIGVLVWGMHVQNVGVNLFACLAIYLLALASERNDAGHRPRCALLFPAILFAFFATFTSASGLLVSFLLIPQALILQFRWREIVLITAAAILSAFLFLHGNSQGDTIHTLTTNPLGVIRFFFLFLGCIVPQALTLSDTLTQQPLVFSLGLASVLLFAVNAIACIRRRSTQTRQAPVYILFCGLFFVISAALVSVGRLPLGIDHAYTEHYNILRVLYWANLLLSIGICWNTRVAWYLTSALSICAAGALTTGISPRDMGMPYRSAVLNDAAAAMAAEIYDPRPWHSSNGWRATDPDAVQFMRSQTQFLHQHELSIFHDAPAAWSQRNIQSLPVAITRCPGAITESHIDSDVVGHFQIVTGWVNHSIHTQKQPQIVLVDSTGKIVGFGATLVQPPGKTDWKGYVRSDSPPVAAYFFNSGQLFRLADNTPATRQ